jgi:hypothetical protein
MAESIWANRLYRLWLLARAPWLFATAQSYRQALFKGMQQGEILLLNGVRRVLTASDPRDQGLPLVLRQGPPTVTLVASTIAFDIAGSDEGRLAATLVCALAGLDLDFRVIAVAEPSFPHEARVRAWLQNHCGLAPSAQTRMEFVDATDQFVTVGPDDIFIVTAGQAQAALLRERFAARTAEAEIHLLCAQPAVGHGLAEGFRTLALPADVSLPEAQAALAGIVDRGKRGAPQRFAERSRLGLGYRVLKPLADTHAPGRTCLFVHFDPHGRIDPHVMRYLAALKGCGLDIVFISSCDLQPEAVAAVEPLTAAIVTRQNKGLDFAGWALALELFPRLLQSDSLVIANDSVYGPVGDLGALFERALSRAGTSSGTSRAGW